MSGKPGRKWGQLRGEYAEIRDLACCLRGLADSHGVTVRVLEDRMPYGHTAISENLSGEKRPTWTFVTAFLDACAERDHKARDVLENRVRPLWEAAGPGRTRRLPEESDLIAPDQHAWVVAVRETAAAQQMVARLQESVSRHMALVQGLMTMLARLSTAARELSDERDTLRRELRSKADIADELLATRALLEDTQRRLEAAERLYAETSRRLDNALHQREEAERLKGAAVIQAERARHRLADLEQHAVKFLSLVRGDEVIEADATLMDGTDQSVAAEILDKVDHALSEEASTLGHLHDELAGAADITVLSAGHSERTATETARREDERYRALVQGDDRVGWVTAPDGKILEDSPQWRWITGQTEEEFRRDGWTAFIHSEDRDRIERGWKDSLGDGKLFDSRFRMRTKSGAYRHYDVRAAPVTRAGRIIEWVGVCTDVTIQHESDEMRGRLTEQLSAAALRTARLQQASSMLSDARTVEQVVEVITEVGRSAIGALRSAVAVFTTDSLRLRIVNDPGMNPGAWDAVTGDMALDMPSVITRAITTRRPVMVEDPDDLRRQFADQLDTGAVELADEQAWASLPLIAGGAPLGALRFAFGRPRTIRDEERVFLEALAGQCALAIERAGLYEREYTVAETMQRSLLPDKLPAVAGLRFEARYLPVARNMEVGGDWYDVFRLPDQRLVVTVGDVMGKGLTAVAGMGRVRNALRTAALTDPRPAAVISSLDRLFSTTETEEQLATVWYLVIDPETGEGHYANAGHPPALIIGGPREMPMLDPTEVSTPLGWPTVRKQHPFKLPDRATAVFYSDGLVENRTRSLDAGLDELVKVATAAPPVVRNQPGQLLQHLLDHMLAGHEQDDDVTVVTMCRSAHTTDDMLAGDVPPGTSGGRSRLFVKPPELSQRMRVSCPLQRTSMRGSVGTVDGAPRAWAEVVGTGGRLRSWSDVHPRSRWCGSGGGLDAFPDRPVGLDLDPAADGEAAKTMVRWASMESRARRNHGRRALGALTTGLAALSGRSSVGNRGGRLRC